MKISFELVNLKTFCDIVRFVKDNPHKFTRNGVRQREIAFTELSMLPKSEEGSQVFSGTLELLEGADNVHELYGKVGKIIMQDQTYHP